MQIVSQRASRIVYLWVHQSPACQNARFWVRALGLLGTHYGAFWEAFWAAPEHRITRMLLYPKRDAITTCSRPAQDLSQSGPILGLYRVLEVVDLGCESGGLDPWEYPVCRNRGYDPVIPLLPS